MGQAFGCIQVHHSTVAVKEKHGKYDNVLKPGCYCLPWCLGHHVAGKVSSRVQQLEVRCEAKTKDDAFVNVFACIQYHVMEDKANDAFYKLSDAKGQIQAKGLIQANVFNVITASVLKRNWDSAFEKKDDIAKDVKEKLEESMSAYGFKIDQVLITNIEPDITVKKAMNERTAEAIKSAAKIKAEPEKISQIKPAEGEAEAETTEPEKISQIKPAKGEAEAETISQIKPAKGEAEPETISQIKPAEGEAEPAEGEAEPEKISQIKPAEGEAEPETISQIKPAEGEAEPEKISQIKPAKGEADPA